jgi:large subunit ribosomal protein L25
VLNDLEISCLPKDLPEFIEVDLKDLQAGHSLHLSGLNMPSGVEAIVPKGEDPTVATVVIPKVMTAEEELAEAATLTAAPAAADVPTTNQKVADEAAPAGGGGAGSKPTVKDDKKNMKEAKDKK